MLRLPELPKQTTSISTKYSHQLSPSAEKLYRFVLDFCAKESREVRCYLDDYYAVGESKSETGGPVPSA